MFNFIVSHCLQISYFHEFIVFPSFEHCDDTYLPTVLRDNTEQAGNTNDAGVSFLNMYPKS